MNATTTEQATGTAKPADSPHLTWPHELANQHGLAFEAAKNRLHRAQVAGNPEERAIAQQELDDIQAALVRHEHQAAAAFFYQFRLAIESRPFEFGVFLRDALRSSAEIDPQRLAEILLGVLADPIGDAIDDALRDARRAR